MAPYQEFDEWAYSHDQRQLAKDLSYWEKSNLVRMRDAYRRGERYDGDTASAESPHTRFARYLRESGRLNGDDAPAAEPDSSGRSILERLIDRIEAML